MNPSVSRSLGAAVLALPRADDGMIIGAPPGRAIAAPATAADLIKSRRVSGVRRVGMAVSLCGTGSRVQMRLLPHEYNGTLYATRARHAPRFARLAAPLAGHGLPARLPSRFDHT